ncbi:MAG: SMP-30/gluconolactonase/LRE family protein [Myxococcota bacterium]
MRLTLPRPAFAPLVSALLLPFAGCGDDAGATSTDASTGSTTSSTDADTGTPSSTAGEETPATGDTTAGESEDTSADSSSGGVGGCWDDLPIGESEEFYNGFKDGSEGLAFGADGLLYVTTMDNGGTVWQLDADGNISEFASVPTALGLARRADGGFTVAAFGVAEEPDGAVYLVDAKGAATEIATGIDSPNFVTIMPDGSSLISDDFVTTVFRVTDEGDVSLALENVPSPNGMAYSPSGDTLYVASTFTKLGQLTRYDVDETGAPIEDTGVEIMHLGPLSTPDGIAVDADGFVYVAANIPGEIWRVDGAVTELTKGELVADGLQTPASLAFGAGPGFDPCSIYMTQLLGSRVLRVSIGAEGAPLYE